MTQMQHDNGIDIRYDIKNVPVDSWIHAYRMLAVLIFQF